MNGSLKTNEHFLSAFNSATKCCSTQFSNYLLKWICILYSRVTFHHHIGIFWKSHQTNKKRTNFQLSWTTILECLFRKNTNMSGMECSWCFAIAFPLSVSLLHTHTQLNLSRGSMKIFHSMKIFKLFDEWAQTKAVWAWKQKLKLIFTSFHCDVTKVCDHYNVKLSVL